MITINSDLTVSQDGAPVGAIADALNNNPLLAHDIQAALIAFVANLNAQISSANASLAAAQSSAASILSAAQAAKNNPKLSLADRVKAYEVALGIALTPSQQAMAYVQSVLPTLSSTTDQGLLGVAMEAVSNVETLGGQIKVVQGITANATLAPIKAKVLDILNGKQTFTPPAPAPAATPSSAAEAAASTPAPAAQAPATPAPTAAAATPAPAVAAAPTASAPTAATASPAPAAAPAAAPATAPATA